MQTYQFGLSKLGLPILAYEFGHEGPNILILGGVHGNESEGVVAAMGLIKELKARFPYKLKITVVPTFNIEGVIAKSRTTSAGVDLNRNLPTKDWTPIAAKPEYQPGPSANSEPENQALTAWIDRHKPKFIWSLHSWKPMVNVNGDCYPEAKVIEKMTGYVITEDIGYPTPGSLGTYSLEIGVPTITFEIERGQAPEDTLRMHVPAILEALKVSESRLK